MIIWRCLTKERKHIISSGCLPGLGDLSAPLNACPKCRRFRVFIRGSKILSHMQWNFSDVFNLATVTDCQDPSASWTFPSPRWYYGPWHVLVTASAMHKNHGVSFSVRLGAGSLAALRGAELWQEPLEVGNCSTQLGQKWKSPFRKVFVTSDTLTPMGSSYPASVLVSSWTGTKEQLPYKCKEASGSRSDPRFFHEVNLQLGYAICLLLPNKRTCNERISIDKVTQAITTSCLLGQPCYKKKCLNISDFLTTIP